MEACSFASQTPDETLELARALGRTIAANDDSGDGAAGRPPAVVVLLIGPLGAGKTLFARGLAEGLGHDPNAIASPTFTLAAEHRGAGLRRLVHADCYRLRDADELEAMGVADWLTPGTVLAVEWGDRFAESFAGDRLELTLARTAEVGNATASSQPRRIDARAAGPASRALLEAWRSAGRDGRTNASPGA